MPILEFIDTYSTPILIILTMAGLIWAIYSNKRGEEITTEKKSDSDTPFLDEYSRDLIELAEEGQLDPLIGRTEELDRIIQILCRRTKNNSILVGEAGVGKTAIVEGLALAIIEKRVPDLLAKKRVLALNLGALLAGTKFRGEFEQRVEELRKEIIEAQRKIILFIDEIQILSTAGEAMGAVGAANLLKPFLARGDLQVIGAATPEDYYHSIQNDTSMERRFQPVVVEEPSPEDTLRIIRGLRDTYEKYHQVEIGEEMLEEAVNLTEKYLAERFLPDKAIDLIDEAAARINLSKIRGDKKMPADKWPQMKVHHLEDVIFQWSKDVNILKQKKEFIEKERAHHRRI